MNAPTYPVDRKPLMEPKTVAEILGVCEKTLSHWRMKKIGPNYVKVGHYVRYDKNAVEDYIQKNTKIHNINSNSAPKNGRVNIFK